MPTYDYQCEKCNKPFELFQSMKDAALKTCPKEACRQKTWGKGRVKRQMGTGAGLIFKGSGFYTTDYRSEGYKASAKSEAGGGETKSESKPGDAKTGDAKSADAKKAEPKPAAPEKPKPTAKKKHD